MRLEPIHEAEGHSDGLALARYAGRIVGVGANAIRASSVYR